MVRLEELRKLDLRRDKVYEGLQFNKDDIDDIIFAIIKSPDDLFNNGHGGMTKIELLQMYFQARSILKGSGYTDANLKIYLELEG